MISFFANIFGYVLNFLYELVGNYGFAIILFSILVKVIMLPISIRQQKTMEKSQKINEEMQRIQFVYKNDPEKMNQEVMALYKRENMSPFSGCFSAIVQLILLFSVFFLVRSPLTYMKKVDTEVIDKLETVVEEAGYSSNYKEIAILNYINNLEEENITEEQENEEKIVENETEENNENIEDIEETENKEDVSEEEFNVYDYKDELYINMNFLGLDLSKVPTENLDNLSVLIIPALYVLSSFISMRMTNNTNKKKKNKKEQNLISDGKTEEETIPNNDPMAEANKSMNWIMPIMSISIACIAPLGLALYWLMNNVLMILEKIVINKLIKNKEEAKEDA